MLPKKFTVCRGLWVGGIIGPYYFNEDGDLNVTLWVCISRSPGKFYTKTSIWCHTKYRLCRSWSRSNYHNAVFFGEGGRIKLSTHFFQQRDPFLGYVTNRIVVVGLKITQRLLKMYQCSIITALFGALKNCLSITVNGSRYGLMDTFFVLPKWKFWNWFTRGFIRTISHSTLHALPRTNCEVSLRNNYSQVMELSIDPKSGQRLFKTSPCKTPFHVPLV